MSNSQGLPNKSQGCQTNDCSKPLLKQINHLLRMRRALYLWCLGCFDDMYKSVIVDSAGLPAHTMEYAHQVASHDWSYDQDGS